MKKPKLSILIATIGERNERFQRLLDLLTKQVTDEVEILAYWNNGELPLGDIRQTLVDKASGQYICFIDDDDSVPNYYIEMILRAIKEKPDYVGWQMQLYHDGEKMKPTYHSIRYDRWFDDEDGYYRNISHLNPIKRSIAKQVSFKTPQGTPEDASWSQRVAPLVNSEVYIDKPMYFYYHQTHDSRWRGDDIKRHNSTRPVIVNKNFRYVEAD